MGHDNRMPPLVLVVEDDALVRMAAVCMVEDAGFGTLEAANADDALEILASRDDIRIVFTDVQMPGSMDGLRLAAAVSDRWPPIRLIVTSGRVALSAKNLPTGGLFLPKPYAAGQLADMLQACAL